MIDVATNFDRAKALASLGFAVLPVQIKWDAKRGGYRKTPLTPEGFYSATSEPEMIEQWWIEHPDAVPGVWLGASGLVVLDIDDHDGTGSGHDTLDELWVSSPETHAYPTTSGNGAHHIFHAPEGRTFSRTIGDGLEVLGGDKFAVWHGPVPVDVTEIAECPKWLAEYVTRAPERGAGFTEGVEAWKAAHSAAPDTEMQGFIDRLPTPGNDAYGHQSTLQRLAALMALAELHTGGAAALAAFERHYLTGWEEYEPDWEAMVSWAVERCGTPAPGEPEEQPSLYANVGGALDGTIERLKATVGTRTDRQCLFYAGKVNTLFGDPEGGKSLIAAAIAVETLQQGGKVLWLDLDHNGVQEIVSRLLDFGADPARLRDPEAFRLLDNPDDPELVLRAVQDARSWMPTIAVVDSMGELIPMFGGNSDSADDYTSINRRVNSALAETGAAVIAIDHLAKGEGSRKYGAGGTMAKKRAANGAYVRVENIRPFAPGAGGKSVLKIGKDRPGDLRANSGPGNNPLAATFDLHPSGSFKFWAPTSAEPDDEQQDDPRFKEMAEMPRLTIAALKDRFSIGTDRARELKSAYESRNPF